MSNSLKSGAYGIFKLVTYNVFYICRFAFVEFNSVDDAKDAQRDKDGLEINGRVVQLAFANDKPSGGGGGGGGGYGGGGGGGRELELILYILIRLS